MEILRFERDLNRVVEDDVREEILKMRDYESLNNEKMSPYFLSLARRPQNADNLGDVTRDDGTLFETKLERDNYIKSTLPLRTVKFPTP
jgi:hypothetical protein